MGGGCAMIGQSMINVTSGGKMRISGVTAAVVLLLIILVASPIIDLIPMGGLIGVMFMVVYYTFEWGSLKFIATIFFPAKARKTLKLASLKVNRPDAITVVIVTVVTIFTNLAVAVFCGIIFTALNYAWTAGKQIGFEGDPIDKDGVRTYNIEGTLFFASTRQFMGLFPPAVLDDCPDHVTLRFHNGEVADFSGLEALRELRELFHERKKELRVAMLSESSKKMIDKAAGLFGEVEYSEKEITVDIAGEGKTGLHIEQIKPGADETDGVDPQASA